MTGENEPDRIAAAYRRFAEDEAHGRSSLYEAIAIGVAGDAEIVAFLMGLPRAKRQPNLLLAAVRRICGTACDYVEFRRFVLDNAERVRALMLARATQTNEPGRCAVLLPVLALLPQPLALIEVGASAGLCLLPDRYGYDYGDGRLLVPTSASGAAIFPCAVDPATPVPAALPQIVWRAGLDLAPVDLADPEQAAWLKALVWPEQTDRLTRLEAAMAIAGRERPRVAEGDLRRDLAALAAEAPRDAALVVFHTAVLAYVADRGERTAFAREAGALCDFWIANEAPHVFPDIAARAKAAPPQDAAYAAAGAGRFLLSMNGRPIAWTDPHGASLAWIADPVVHNT